MRRGQCATYGGKVWLASFWVEYAPKRGIWFTFLFKRDRRSTAAIVERRCFYLYLLRSPSTDPQDTRTPKGRPTPQQNVPRSSSVGHNTIYNYKFHRGCQWRAPQHHLSICGSSSWPHSLLTCSSGGTTQLLKPITVRYLPAAPNYTKLNGCFHEHGLESLVLLHRPLKKSLVDLKRRIFPAFK